MSISSLINKSNSLIFNLLLSIEIFSMFSKQFLYIFLSNNEQSIKI